MKFLFSSRPAHGHVFPIMPLAEAAREAGHDVVFSTTGEFVPKLEGLGFAVEPVGIPIEAGLEEFYAAGRTMAAEDGRTDLDGVAELFVSIVGHRTAIDLVPVLQRVEPDVVVYEQYEFGAPVAAAAVGVPSVVHSISPQLPTEIRRDFGGQRIAALCDELGVATGSIDPFVGDGYLDIFPSAVQEPSFRSDPARLALRPVAWSEPGSAVPSWVATARRPIVYLTLGTVVATDEVLLPAIEGLASLDAEVLVALGAAPGDLGPLPANVHLESFVDQAALMPHVDVIVHHGGSGTLLAALANGVPQVLTPKGADQFLNADLVAAAGLAPVVMPMDATAETIALAAKSALTEPNRLAIDAVRAEIATMPDPAFLAAELARRYG